MPYICKLLNWLSSVFLLYHQISHCTCSVWVFVLRENFVFLQDSDQAVDMSEGSRDSSPNIHHQLQLHHLGGTSAISPAISNMSGVSCSKVSKHHSLSGDTPSLHHPNADLETRPADLPHVNKQLHHQAHQEHPAAHSWHPSGGLAQNISPAKPLPKHRRYSQSSQGGPFTQTQFLCSFIFFIYERLESEAERK